MRQLRLQAKAVHIQAVTILKLIQAIFELMFVMRTRTDRWTETSAAEVQCKSDQLRSPFKN